MLKILMLTWGLKLMLQRANILTMDEDEEEEEQEEGGDLGETQDHGSVAPSAHIQPAASKAVPQQQQQQQPCARAPWSPAAGRCHPQLTRTRLPLPCCNAARQVPSP